MAEGASGREGGGMIWTRQGPTGMASPPWRVRKVTVRGAVRYELWNEGQPGIIGRFSTFDAARKEAERQHLGLVRLLTGE